MTGFDVRYFGFSALVALVKSALSEMEELDGS